MSGVALVPPCGIQVTFRGRKVEWEEGFALKSRGLARMDAETFTGFAYNRNDESQPADERG